MPSEKNTTMTPHVLIVDDCIELCQGMARIFTASGISTHIESDGRRALDVLRDEDFDLLITDICMPHVGGDVLVRCVGQLRPHLPCIVITGLSERDTLDFVAKCPNVVTVIKKPLNTQRLAAIIHGFCRADAESRSNFAYWRTLLGIGKTASPPPVAAAAGANSCS